jgi:hypothetical protein
MVRSFATLARHYADLLRFWRACPHKICRRERRCRDHKGACWMSRYPKNGEIRDRLKARVQAARVHLPAEIRTLHRGHDPGDCLL